MGRCYRASFSESPVLFLGAAGKKGILKGAAMFQRCDCHHFGPRSGCSNSEDLVKRTNLLISRPQGAWGVCAVVSGSSSDCYPNGVRVVPPHAVLHPLCSPPKAVTVGSDSKFQSSGCAASRPFITNGAHCLISAGFSENFMP